MVPAPERFMRTAPNLRAMKAVLLAAAGRFETEERDRPVPDAGEVLVRIDHVGICGSDLHYYRHGENGDNRLEEPTVMGHETAGTVVDRGAAVDSVAAGDRVALEPGVPCGDCEYCRRGEYNLCADVRFMGSPPDDGALVEYLAWPAEYAYRLPEGVSTRAGACCEPLSVGIHAARRGDVGEGDVVLVTGCGPIGLLAADAARAAGASAVLVADVVDRKLALAAERGAAGTIDAGERDLAEAVREYVDGDGVDVVLECSGARAAIDRLPAAVRKGGRVVFVGLPTDPALPTDVFGAIDNELDLRGSHRFRDTFPRAVELLAGGQVDADSLVDFELPLAETRAAFERADDPAVVKGMLSLGE